MEVDEILESLGDAFLAMDRQWRITHVNGLAAGLFAMPREEMVGRDFWSVSPAAVGSELERRFRRAMADRTTARFEHPCGPQDCWCAIEALPLKEDRLATFWRDITDSRGATEALRQSEERYRQLAELSPDAILVNLQGRFVYANLAAVRLLGAGTPAEILGRSPFDFIEPEYHATVRERISRLLRRQQANPLVEQRWRRLDGTPIDLEVTAGTITWVGQPAIQVLLRDISRRKRTESLLQTREEQLRLFIQYAPAALAMFDREMNYLLASQRWKSDYRLGDVDLTGRSHYEVFPELPPAWKKAHRRALAGERLASSGDRFERADGSVQWIKWELLPWRGGDGEIGGLVLFTEDITREKEVEATLRQAREAADEANRAKSDFLANMSHEIRTPMTIFMAAIEHLLQNDVDPEHRPFLEMADRAATHLHLLVDDILDFSKIEADRIELAAEPFDLRACLRHTVEMLEPQARQKGLVLRTELAPDLPALVVGDPARLGQILVNLIGNAIKFTSEGEVVVTLAVAGGRLDFAVRDTGIGIPEDKVGLLFQSFSQVDSSLTRKFGGTGLGLAISRRLTELMGGRIGYRRREGGGSVFHFTLPLALPQEGAAQASPEPRASEGGRPLATPILLVEDEPNIGRMIQQILAQRGWRSDIAGSGQEALRKWQESHHQVILMDLQLPGMDGLEAARRIRAAENSPQGRPRIIGLTAHARREIREQCLEVGMDAVVTKPIKMRDLFAAIEGGGVTRDGEGAG